MKPSNHPGGKEEGSDGRAPTRKGPSTRQVEANRKNSQNSTGPKDAEGKARSAQNATKHGVFAATAKPLKKGPFAEDPEEFALKIDALVDSLEPRDAVEQAMAVRIATLYNSFDRLERWSTATMNGESKRTEMDHEIGIGSFWSRRARATMAKKLLSYMEGRLPEEEALFEVFATLVREFGPNPKVGVAGLWDAEHEPESPEEWKKAYRSLVAHHWPGGDAALWWAFDLCERMNRELEELDGLEEQRVANRILHGPLDLQLKYHARIRRELTEMSKQYAELQKRELPGKNEPNLAEDA